MYLIIYDISSDKIRAKIAKRLTAEGYDRIQLSVFSGIFSPKLNISLWKDLNLWIGNEKDAKFFVLKTWDRKRLPYPFSTIRMKIGNPIQITRDNFDEAHSLITKRLG